MSESIRPPPQLTARAIILAAVLAMVLSGGEHVSRTVRRNDNRFGDTCGSRFHGRAVAVMYALGLMQTCACALADVR